MHACMGEPQNPYRQQLGVSIDEGTTFAAELLFGCIPGPLVCPGGGIAQQCAKNLGLLQASVGACDDDAGAIPCGEGGCDSGNGDDSDGSGPAVGQAGMEAGLPLADGGGESPAGPKTGCGCGAGEAAGASGVSVLAVAVLALIRRRRFSL